MISDILADIDAALDSQRLPELEAILEIVFGGGPELSEEFEYDDDCQPIGPFYFSVSIHYGEPLPRECVTGNCKDAIDGTLEPVYESKVEYRDYYGNASHWVSLSVYGVELPVAGYLYGLTGIMPPYLEPDDMGYAMAERGHKLGVELGALINWQE